MTQHSNRGTVNSKRTVTAQFKDEAGGIHCIKLNTPTIKLFDDPPRVPSIDIWKQVSEKDAQKRRAVIPTPSCFNRTSTQGKNLQCKVRVFHQKPNPIYQYERVLRWGEEIIPLVPRRHHTTVKRNLFLKVCRGTQSRDQSKQPPKVSDYTHFKNKIPRSDAT